MCHLDAQILLKVLEITKQPSFNLVFPYICRMASRLERFNDTVTTHRKKGREVIRHVDYHPAVVEFRHLLLDQFQLRFDDEREGHQEDLLICTLLDPRFKNFTFKGATPEMAKNARAFASVSLRDNFTAKLRANLSEEAVEQEESNRTTGFSLSRRKAPTGVQESFLDSDEDDEMDEMDDGDEEPERAEDEPMLGVPAEIQLYLGLREVTDKNLDLLGWWKLHAHMFPALARMARQFLALPASSAGVERLFSSAGTINGNLRKNTKEATMQSLLFVKQNY